VAKLTVDGNSLMLSLSPFEEIEGFHGSISVPVSSVREIRAVDDPWSQLRGLRAPGTGVPKVISVGTRRGGGIKDFVVVHGGGPVVVVEMEGAEFDRFVVTAEDATSVADKLRRQVGLSGTQESTGG
jgi:hypothetical protein